MNYPYSELFTSIKVGSLELKNRFAMAPMASFGIVDNGGILTDDGIEYFAVEDETYYPKEFYYTVPRTTISSRKEFDEFNKKIQSAEELRCFLRRFFAESEHGKLYFNQHNKENEK